VQGRFALSASPDPTDFTQWQLLDPSVFALPGGYGSCPSIRFDPSTGYYYVLTGGNEIAILRSLDLQKWEVGGGEAW
jgi:hypothetical protein